MTKSGKRKVERLRMQPTARHDRAVWEECELCDIVTGDVFRFWEPDRRGVMTPYTDACGAMVFVALDNAAPAPDSAPGAWGVASGRVNGFEAMDWSR